MNKNSGRGIRRTRERHRLRLAGFRRKQPFEDLLSLRRHGCSDPDFRVAVRVWQVSQRSNSVNVPPQVWRDWRDGLKSVTSLAASGGAGTVNVSDGADAERAIAASVSRNFFETFGVSPVIGRGFSHSVSSRSSPQGTFVPSATRRATRGDSRHPRCLSIAFAWWVNPKRS